MIQSEMFNDIYNHHMDPNLLLMEENKGSDEGSEDTDSSLDEQNIKKEILDNIG